MCHIELLEDDFVMTSKDSIFSLREKSFQSLHLSEYPKLLLASEKLEEHHIISIFIKQKYAGEHPFLSRCYNC